MSEENNDIMARKALKAIASEDLEGFIDKANISDEDLKKALLTAIDIDTLQHEYQIIPKK